MTWYHSHMLLRTIQVYLYSETIVANKSPCWTKTNDKEGEHISRKPILEFEIGSFLQYLFKFYKF